MIVDLKSQQKWKDRERKYELFSNKESRKQKKKEDKLENIIMPLYKYIMHGNLNYCVHTSSHLSQTYGYDTTHSTHKVARMAGSIE